MTVESKVVESQGKNYVLV